MKYDAFISHSSKDKAVADKICEYLEQHDIKCWIAPRNVLGGMPYACEIFNGIDESQILLLILSENSNVSRHVEREIDRAFNKEKVIIPVPKYFKLNDSNQRVSFEDVIALLKFHTAGNWQEIYDILKPVMG